MNFNSQEPSSPEPSPAKSILQGMFYLGKGKKEGIEYFPASTEGLLNALLPWTAIYFLSSYFIAFSLAGHDRKYLILFTASLFLSKLCSILTAMVIIEFFSSFWKINTSWKRTVTALLWCEWLPIIDLIVLSFLIGTLLAFSVFVLLVAFSLLLVFCVTYFMWILWFSLKAGMDIDGKRSALLVVLLVITDMVFQTLLTVLNPTLFEHWQKLSLTLFH